MVYCSCVILFFTGHVEMTQVLLDAGVDVHCKDAKSGWQPIHIAACKLVFL